MTAAHAATLPVADVALTDAACRVTPMLSLLPALLLFAFVSAATPGPNNLMLMTSGLNFGVHRPLPPFWGVDLGVAATYTDPNHYTLSVLLVASVFAVVTAPCSGAWVGFGAALQRWLTHPRNLAIFNWTMAALLVASLYPVFRE